MANNATYQNFNYTPWPSWYLFPTATAASAAQTTVGRAAAPNVMTVLYMADSTARYSPAPVYARNVMAVSWFADP